jgi:hypothetical protein
MSAGTRWFHGLTEIRTEWDAYGDWFAYLPDEYDGAPDAGPHITGRGTTEREAVEEVKQQLEEREEDATRTYVNLKELPMHVANDLAEFQKENGLIADTQLVTVLDAYLRWNGIIGYTAGIMSIFEARYGQTRKG